MQRFEPQPGFSTIEIILAFGIGMSFLSAAMMLLINDQHIRQRLSLTTHSSITESLQCDSVRLHIARTALDELRAELRQNWYNIFTTSSSDHTHFITYPPDIIDLSPCLKVLTLTTESSSTPLKHSTTHLTTAVVNSTILKKLGGDCDALPNAFTWQSPKELHSYSNSSQEFTTIDVFAQTAYIGTAGTELSIVEIIKATDHAVDTSQSIDVGKRINDIDVAEYHNPVSRVLKRYAYLATHSSTTQVQIVDVTDANTPQSTPAMNLTLTGRAAPRGSFPQGWRTNYFDSNLYVLTRETAGYEFHIIDVKDPTQPREIGPGLEINGTANDLVVTDVQIGTQEYRFVFLATERAAAEIMVLNVTDPLTPTIITTLDLPTNLDALSLALSGNRLYVGRQRYTGGPEITVHTITFGTTTPFITFTPLGAGADIGGNVTNLRVVGEKLFMTTSLANNSVQIWDIASPHTGPIPITTSLTHSPARVSGEIEYAHPYLYLASSSPEPLRVLADDSYTP